MTGLHRIERLEFDIGHADEASAWAHAQRVQHFVSGPATAVIAAVFDEIADGDEVHRWALLEVDLGVLSIDAPDEAWAEQLRDALRVAAESARDTVAAGATVRSRQQSDLEQLAWWLQHGHLPWQTGAADAQGDAFDRLAERLLAEQGPALAQTLVQAHMQAQMQAQMQALRQASDGERLLERVALQWPLPLLDRLAQVMALPAPGAEALAMPPVTSQRDGAADVRRRWLHRALATVGSTGAAGSRDLAGEPALPAASGSTPDTAPETVAWPRSGTPADPQRGATTAAEPTDLATAVALTTAPVAAQARGTGPGTSTTGAVWPAHESVNEPALGNALGNALDVAARSAIDTRAGPALAVAAGAAPDLAPGLAPGPTPASTPDAPPDFAPDSTADKALGGVVDPVSDPAIGPVDPALAWPLDPPPIAALSTAVARLGAGRAAPGVAALRRLALPLATWRTLTAQWSINDRAALVEALAPADAGPIGALADAALQHVRAASLEAPLAAADAWAFVLHRLATAPAQQPGTREDWLETLANHLEAAGAPADTALRQALAAAWPAPDALPMQAAAPAGGVQITAAAMDEVDRSQRSVRTALDTEAAVRGDSLQHPATRAAPETADAASAAASAADPDAANARPRPSRPDAGGRAVRLDTPAGRPDATAAAAAAPADSPAAGGATLAATPAAAPRVAPHRVSAAEILIAAARCLDLLALACVRAGLPQDVGMLRRTGVALLAQEVAAERRGSEFDLAGFVQRWLDALPPALASPSLGQPGAAPMLAPASPPRWPQRLAHALRAADAARPGPAAADLPSGGPRAGPAKAMPPGAGQVVPGMTTKPTQGARSRPPADAASAAPPTVSLAAPASATPESLSATVSSEPLWAQPPESAAGGAAPLHREPQATTSAVHEALPGMTSAAGAAPMDGAALRPLAFRTSPDLVHASAPYFAAAEPPPAAAEPDPTQPAQTPRGAAPGQAAEPLAPTEPALPGPAWCHARGVLTADGALLRQRLADLVEAAAVATPPPPPRSATQPLPRATRAPDPSPPTETIYIGNAGLVLAGPYLPRLLARLGLLAGDRFADDAAARRAVQVLQVVVDGRPETPEHRLALNKLLCGVPLATPVAREIELSAAERHVITGLLEALIGHWTALGRTSVAGLRETFLQREGALRRADDGWRLLVQPRPFDMLLDRLPWGFRTCKFPWMDEVLHVEWR